MPHAAFGTALPATDFDRLPIEIHHRTSPISAVVSLLFLVLGLLAALVPVGLIATHAAAHRAPASLIIANPLASLQILMAIVLYGLVFALPMKRLLGRVLRQRVIALGHGRVVVTDRYLGRSTSWSLPLFAYRGLAHNVRTTISGTSDELILVHKDKRLSLLLRSGEVINAEAIQSACHLLALPQLPARDLYFKLGNIRHSRLAAFAPRHLIDHAT